MFIVCVAFFVKGYIDKTEISKLGSTYSAASSSESKQEAVKVDVPVDFKELKKNNLDVSDLIESMRGLGYFSLNSVDYAIYESNGTLSAIESQNNDVKSLPLLIVNNGKFLLKNLKLIKTTENEMIEKLKTITKSSVKKIGVFTIDGQGNFYLQELNKKFITGKTSLKEGVEW
jgi:hypothetical protein